MSVLCANNTHVYRTNPSSSSGGAATRCDCGAQANNPPIVNVPNPHHPRYVPPVAVPEIPASVKQAAKRCGASHLSADGSTAYRSQMGRIEWIDLESSYPSWWPADDGIMPCGVVSVE